MSEKLNSLALEIALLSNANLEKLASILNDVYPSRSDALVSKIEVDFREKHDKLLKELGVKLFE
jgi:hypothetical protein